MKSKIKEIEINALILDVENYRYGGGVTANQREAVAALLHIKDMGKKILKLAEHIAEHGLDPTELPLVIPLKKGKSTQYIVTEGNRRLLALMLLRNPGLAPSDVYRKKVEKLTSPTIKRSLEKIFCSVVPDRATSDMWVYNKHTGENEGTGRVSWDGLATDAFRMKHGHVKSAGRQVLDYIEADKGFSSDIKNRISEIDITTLTRLFQGSPAKKAFGLVSKNGLIESVTPLNDLRGLIEHTVNLMLESGFNVKKVYHKADQEKFLNENVPADMLPSKNNVLGGGETWKLSNLDTKGLTKEQKQGKTPKKVSAATKTTRSNAQSKHRDKLIDFTLKIRNKRINAIYGELKNNLSVHGSPNAVSVLFRVFLELTCDWYIEKNKVTRSDNNKLLTRDVKLRIKVEHIANDLDANKLLTKTEASAIRKVASSKNELASVDTLNQYIHASELSPIPTEQNTLMDNWAPLFKAVWK